MNIPGTRYEGSLERKTNRWKEYYVVLNNGQLLFYKDRNSDPRDGLLGTLKLSVNIFCNSSSSGVLTRGYQFSVTTPDIEAHLRASTSEQRDTWIKEIMGSVTELNDYNRMISMRPSQMSHPEPQVYDSTLVVNMPPEHEWYWPGKTRDQAEQLLKQVDSNHFLVRDSGHEPGSYSLSVRVGTVDNKVIFHYIIKRDHQENKFILVPAPEKRFDTLDQVIAYYLNLNKDVGLQPLKNPAYKPHQASLYGGNAAAALQSDNNVSNLTYNDPVASGMTVNPHDKRRSLVPASLPLPSTSASTETSGDPAKRRSVADILDEEFDMLETGDTRANSYKAAVTQNPSSHTTSDQGGTVKVEGTENEYVRLGKFAAAKQDSHPHEVDGSPSKAPVKPNRPSLSRPGQSEYMNVTTQPPPQDVISGTSNGGGNYIYAKVGMPPGPGPNTVSGDCIVIRGAERSTPAVARFGDMGAPLSFSRNGSSSLFEDGYSAPNPGPVQESSCYVNCDLNNQVSSVTINDPRAPTEEQSQRPKSSGMSKSSAKAGKNKMAKASKPSGGGGGPSTHYSYKNQYPPVATGPTGYNDPCVSMTQGPPGKSKTAREDVDLFPVAGSIGYTDPALAMSTQPPKSKSHRAQQLEEQFPAAGPAPMGGYTDPCASMSKPPPKSRNSGRHNGNV